MKLNLGCGLTKLEGYLNVDKDPDVKPDEVADICVLFPWENEQFEEVLFLHTIEHIQEKYHDYIFGQIHRILAPNGKLILGYPEFSVCCQFWLENRHGKREFWKNCIYGRQLSKDDFHVCPMHTPEVKEVLETIGFIGIVHHPEEMNPQYTLLKAIKGEARPSYEEVLAKTIFG